MHVDYEQPKATALEKIHEIRHEDDASFTVWRVQDNGRSGMGYVK